LELVGLTNENTTTTKQHEPSEAITAANIKIKPHGFTNDHRRALPLTAKGEMPAQNVEARGGESITSCSACLAHDFSLCAALNNLAADLGPDDARITATVHTIPSRRTICHAKEWSEFVTVICNGWAASSSALPDGRRQIHSILLPGDVVLSTGPFNPVFGHTVEAITDVTYRRYKRSELEALIFEHSDLFKRLTDMWSEARSYANQLALSLGRRTAHERIASFILTLADSLARRGMMKGETMEFPLRLRHIADATGLTPVHVSKVQTEFQRSGLIKTKDRSLTILDRVELHHIAGPQ
jgi:CRP/FNR family transcriptional regulator, anaerobic regulatory protein